MKNNIIITLLFALLCFTNAPTLSAQGKKSQYKVKFSAVVTDTKGNVVPNVLVMSESSTDVISPDESGRFVVDIIAGTVVRIEAEGYKSISHTVSRGESNLKMRLEPELLFAGQKDKVELPLGIERNRRNSVSSVSQIAGDELESHTAMSISGTLQGRLLGVVGEHNNSGLISANKLSVRGQHTLSDNTPLVLVDGVPRSIDNLFPEEIATISVLKDATAKVLYGARATNGVILVTTKRGEANKRVVKSSVEYGVVSTTRTPEYLNSAQYATLYNEARVNDGLVPLYSDRELSGYAASSGMNDIRYPDLDYYDYFLNKMTTIRRASIEFIGGNDNIQYALIGAYGGNGGIVAVGDSSSVNRYDFRGTLDVKVNRIISASMNISGMMNKSQQTAHNVSQIFDDLSTHRPNEYPMFIGADYVEPDINGYPTLGGSLYHKSNLYGDIAYGGKSLYDTYRGFFDFALNFDLNDYVKGLSFRAGLTYDTNFYGHEKLTTSAAVYVPTWQMDAGGNDVPTFYRVTASSKTDVYKLTDETIAKNNSYTGALHYIYDRNNDHKLDATLAYNYYQQYGSGEAQDVISSNLVLSGNYMFRNKYVAELSLSQVGSNRFSQGDKIAYAGAGGVKWIVSEEDFMSNISFVDYLGVKLNGGLLRYDAPNSYFLGQNWYDDSSTIALSNSLKPFYCPLNIAANSEGLDWETSREINFGIEALLFKHRLLFELNYFNEKRTNIITQMSNTYSDIYGVLPYTNYGSVNNQGVEFALSYSGNFNNELLYSVGLNTIYSKNKIGDIDELQYPDGYLQRGGNSTDAIFGYVAEGLFGKDVPLEGHPHQTFGHYQEGDIAYADLNNDGIIDERDRKVIGNSFPRCSFGVDVNLHYKGFGLYLLGTANLGLQSITNNNYYWMDMEDKYSVLASDRWHPTNNPTGEYPRLTTTEANNNFQNSTFWLEKTNFFRLENVELSYTFNYKRSSASSLIKFFVRGTNLAVLSTIKDLDPENLNSGVSHYPVMRTITGGASINF